MSLATGLEERPPRLNPVAAVCWSFIWVGLGQFYMMGDNRNSSDSRVFGPVPRANVSARVMDIFWPRARIQVF